MHQVKEDGTCILTVSAVWCRCKDPFLLVYKGVLRKLRIMVVLSNTNAIPGTISPLIVIRRGSYSIKGQNMPEHNNQLSYVENCSLTVGHRRPSYARQVFSRQ